MNSAVRTRPSATGEALAAPLTGLARPGSKTCKAGDLAPGKRTEFGQLGEQRAGDDRSDAGYALKEVFLLAPHGRTAHGIVDAGIEDVEFFLQRFDQSLGALL